MNGESGRIGTARGRGRRHHIDRRHGWRSRGRRRRPGHGQVAEGEPAPALHRPRRRRPPRADDPPGHAARRAHRGPPRRQRHRDGREALARPAARRGLEHVERADLGARRRLDGGDLLRQHRRADGARHALPAQGAGGEPAGDRRALPVAEPVRLQRPPRRRRRHPRRQRRPAQVCGDGRLLRPQRPRPEAPARRPAQRRHRGAQGAERAPRRRRPHRRRRADQRLRVHRLRRGQRHAVGARRRHRHATASPATSR